VKASERAADIVRRALEATTVADIDKLQEAIIAEVGAEYWRPLGDKWNNQGQLSGAGGSFDHKIIENVTNMQDAVIERAALAKFGDMASVPYQSPQEAVEALLAVDDLADRVTIEFRESDAPTASSKKLTAVFRDTGCGMTAEDVPALIFGVGSSHKVEYDWMQGSFGLGGETTYRNAEGVVLVTRRDPDLLKSYEEDRVVISIVRWRTYARNTRSAQYLVTSHWEKPGDRALPYSVPTSKFPDFAPGTHVALISYGVEGFHRARGGGDEKSLEAVLNTRLFKPLTPVKFVNKILERDRNADILRGLARRLLDNPREERLEGVETLPFNVDGHTYHLPISYWVFAKANESGERRNFVARDHAVIFTSNGQAHRHWDPQQFKSRTTLSKLHDRIFVLVETDELPMEVRNRLFTADRQDFVKTEAAVRLEEEVAGFLNEWEELRDINNAIIRDVITSKQDSRPTINIAKQISRALKMRGFSMGQIDGAGAENSGKGKNKRKKAPIELFPDPTVLEGPEHVEAQEGKTKFVTFVCNATNDFVPRRAQLVVACKHPEINEREITVGKLRGGRMRVSVAVPLDALKGTFSLDVSIADWTRSSGGLGATLRWSTEFEVVEERPRAPRIATGKETGTNGAAVGNLVAIIWKSHQDQDGWSKVSVGDVEPVPAAELAASRPEYVELGKLGDVPIPTLLLNEDYVGLKHYIEARANRLSESGLEQKRDQYAVGVGVGLLMLHQDLERRRKAGEMLQDDWAGSAKEAIARSVLSMMPAFDELAREAGLEE
jgi:hypothetical protein